MTSQILKFTLAFLSSRSLHDQQSHDKNLNVLRTKRALQMKQNAFFIEANKTNFFGMRASVFNPFLANFPILYPLKTPENLCFSGVFRGYKMGTLAGDGLM